jgi:hypothetical protein
MICVAMPSYIQRYDSDQLPSMFATISYLCEMMLAGLVRSCDESNTTTCAPTGCHGGAFEGSGR